MEDSDQHGKNALLATLSHPYHHTLNDIFHGAQMFLKTTHDIHDAS